MIRIGMALDLNQLRIFFVLARTLNFSEAARKLFITQSAVSHSLRKLEEKLGVAGEIGEVEAALENRRRAGFSGHKAM